MINQRGYSEKSVWLPNSYWCYEPYIQAPAVGPLPAAQAGHVTFGCLNTFSKVTAPTLVTWAELLRPGRQRLEPRDFAGHVSESLAREKRDRQGRRETLCW